MDVATMVTEALGRFVSWGATRSDGAAFLADVDMVEAVLAGRYEGEIVQAGDAALRLALLAASVGTAEMDWLAWALAAMAEDWLRPNGDGR